jgi:CPA2 family monovalent cation:H+ antiporter-2
MLATARQLNASLRCAVVAHTKEEAQWLSDSGVNEVLRSQQALAQALARVVAA